MMGQIFNRIKRIIRTEWGQASYKGRNIFEEEDEELRRIIDELNNDRTDEKSDSETKREYYSNPDVKYNAACSVLGVQSDADIKEIKAAYKNLIRKYHPDRAHKLDEAGKSEAERKSREINSAYDYIRKVKGLK